MEQEKPPFAHPKALVDPGANLGNGTRVWAFAHVMPNAVVGKRCNIGDYAFIESGAKLGDDVTVKNGVQVWEGVEAENGVFLGPNCVFTNDLFPRSFIRKTKEEYLVKTLLEGCTIGANTTIVCGHTIGKYSFVAAGAVVSRDVPDYALVMGVPARVKGWVCRCSQRLKFKAGKTTCPECKAKYSLSKDKKKVTALQGK